MPLIGFTKFKEKLKDGRKRQTIRKLRKYPIKVGQTLYLYWKLRTKLCKKIGEEICTEEFKIQMQFYEDWLHSGPVWRVDVLNDSGFGMRTMMDFKVEELAKKDGFENALEMMRWFSKKHGDLNRITFQVIRW